VQAGILEDRPADSGVRSALMADPELSERQKQVLMEIYESFRRENAAAAEAAQAAAGAAAEAVAEATSAGAEAVGAKDADDARVSAAPWSEATAEAQQDDSSGHEDDPSGHADDISGQNRASR
jgi:hypothetical protein